jgi:hypothetical protein
VSDLGDGLRAELEQCRTEAQDYLVLLRLQMQRHVDLKNDLDDLVALLRAQKHDSPGYALACRDIAGLLWSALHEGKR